MQRLILIAVLAISMMIIGCSQTDMNFQSNNPGYNIDQNQQSMYGNNVPGETPDQSNWDAYVNEGQGY